MEQKASILLVDDHPIFRQGLATILQNETDLQVVAEAGDGEIALNMMREHAPDIVVMDISMPKLDGIEATRQIVAEFPDTKIVALSVHSGKQFVRDMLQAGAAGYILKESVPEEMVEGIRAALAGKVYLSNAVSSVLLSDYKNLLTSPVQSSEPSVEPILQTKLHRPPVPADIIPRVHLLELLEEGRQRTMTLISAPAGYGKSIQVSQWLEASQCRSAWLSLDDGENDLRRFVRYLLEAISTSAPSLHLQSHSLLQSAVLPPAKVLARYVMKDVEPLDESIVLVLDDYHRINQTAVHEFLSELLQHPSPFLHLLLITRRDPPLPLGHLRAQGQLNEITMQQLRFSLSETRAFLERTLHLSIDEHTASVLEEKMEGWVTGIRLLAFSMGQEPSPERLARELAEGSYYVQDYLIGEVLSKVPPSLAQALMETSILDRFCAPLWDALRYGGDPQEDTIDALSGHSFIEWLETTHLFVIPLDEAHEWFRYHHLFQKLLQYQLKSRTSAERIARLHLIASNWFAKRSLFDEALHHSLAAGDIEKAASLVEQHRQTTLNEDRVYILEKWLALLPDSVKMQRPALLLAQTWVCDHQFKLSAALPFLDAAELCLEVDSEDSALHGELDHFRGSCDFFQGDGARSLKTLSRALERIPFTSHMIRGEAEMMFSLASQTQGRQAEAVQMLEDILLQPALNAIRETRVLATLVFLKLIAAELDDRGLMYTQRLHDIALQGHYEHARGWSFYLRGMIDFARNDLNAAIENFHQAVEQRYILHRGAAIDSFVGLSLAYQLTRREDLANATLSLLFEFVQPFSDPDSLVLAHSCQARLYLLQGKPEAALCRLTSTNVSSAGVMLWWLEIPAITSCRVLVAEGSATRLQDAEQRLQEYLQLSQDQHNICQRIDILALLALVYKKQECLDKALTVLEEAVTLAEPGGFMRPFVELGLPMADLLDLLNKQNDSMGYIEQILKAFSDEIPVTEPAVSTPSDPTPRSNNVISVETSDQKAAISESPKRRAAAAGDRAWIVESLTDREIEVLELLDQRLYNKEIAEEMAVAVETVKTHLRNLYQKLNASGRRDAVAKARELGILPK